MPAQLHDSRPVAQYTPEGLREYKQTGSQYTYYLYAGSTPILEMDSAGNVVQTLDNAGNVVSTQLYDAYGSSLYGTPSAPYGYGGQSGYYTDSETGLLLLTHRYYDPAEGRFLTRDPIGYSGGMNLYAYVGGNPVNRADPSGLWTAQVGLSGCGGLAAGGTAEGGIVFGYSRRTGFEIGGYFTTGGGGYSGAGGSATVDVTVSGNQGIAALRGGAARTRA